MVTQAVDLKVDNLCLSFGGVQALSDVSLEVKHGEILAIIGPNGAGKTCLLNCMGGFYQPQKGDVYFGGQRITEMAVHQRAKLGISRTFQKPGLFHGLTTVENLLAARHVFLKPGVLSSALYFGWEHRKEVKHRKVVEEIIDFLGIKPIRHKVVGTLPYGLRRRVELGTALALEPKVLLLDEPMAGMNIEEKEDMARFILDVNEDQGITTCLIEHDMEVVMDIADRIIVLDFGHKIAEGSPEIIKADPSVIKAYLGTKE